MKLQDQV